MIHKTYTAPDTVHESYEEIVGALGVRRGDVIHGLKVDRIVNGSKFITVFSEGGQQIFREPKDTARTAVVTRTRVTAESREAENRAYVNSRLLERCTRDWDTGTRAAINEISEQVEQGYLFSYQHLNSLLESQASGRLWKEYCAAVEHVAHIQTEGHARFDPDSVVFTWDHHDVYMDFLEQLKTRLVERTDYTRAVSRSSSVTSNLMDDVERAAIAAFIRDWRFLY